MIFTIRENPWVEEASSFVRQGRGIAGNKRESPWRSAGHALRCDIARASVLRFNLDLEAYSRKLCREAA